MLLTYNRFNSNYFELLDLIPSSGNIANKITELEVLYDHDMGIDHFPVLFRVDLKKIKSLNHNSLIVNTTYEQIRQGPISF